MQDASTVNDYRIEDFCYVDLAVGRYWHRNRPTKVSDIKEIMKREVLTPANGFVEKEVYCTAFRYREDFLTFVKENNGSVSRYDGPSYNPVIYLDIDNEDLGQSLADTKRIITRLVNKYQVNPKWLKVYFSGSKGFHIELRSCWAGAVPLDNFHDVVKRFALEVAGDVEIDTKIYNLTRLFRAPHSVNVKSYCEKVSDADNPQGKWLPVEGKKPLFKVPLHIDEVMNNSIEELEALATTPRYAFKPDSMYAAGSGQVLPELKRAWDANVAWQPPSRIKGNRVLITPGTKGEEFYNPRDQKFCQQMIMRTEFDSPDRNLALLNVIDYAGRVQNYPQYLTETIAHTFLDQKIVGVDPPSSEEVDKLIEMFYSGNWPYEYGCQSPLMERFCCRDHRCKYWNKEEQKNTPESYLEDWDSLSEKYLRLQQNREGNVFSLGYSAIDEVIGDILPGTVGLVTARQGIGKTRWLMNILRNIAKNHNNPNTLFMSLEMQGEAVYESYATQLPFVNDRKEVAEAYQKESEEMFRILTEMKSSMPNLRFCFKDRLSFDQMKEMILAAKEYWKVDHFPIIAIDYMGRMTAKGRGEYEITTELAKGMKDFAKEMNAFVLLIHQSNRAVGGKGDQKLDMTALKDSDHVGDGMDFVIAGYRPNMDEESQRKAKVFRLKAQVLKNRFGPSYFEYDLIYDGAKSLILDPSDAETLAAFADPFNENGSYKDVEYKKVLESIDLGDPDTDVTENRNTPKTPAEKPVRTRKSAAPKGKKAEEATPDKEKALVEKPTRDVFLPNFPPLEERDSDEATLPLFGGEEASHHANQDTPDMKEVEPSKGLDKLTEAQDNMNSPEEVINSKLKGRSTKKISPSVEDAIGAENQPLTSLEGVEL